MCVCVCVCVSANAHALERGCRKATPSKRRDVISEGFGCQDAVMVAVVGVAVVVVVVVVEGT